MWVAAAAVVMGALVQAKGAQAQARAQQQAAQYNASVADRNAVIAKDQAARDAEAQKRNSVRQLGGMRAAYGASGVTIEGSPLDVLEQSAAEAELDRLNITYKGDLKAMGYQEEATLDRFSGETAIQQGRYRSASALLTGAGQAFSMGASGFSSTSSATAVSS